MARWHDDAYLGAVLASVGDHLVLPARSPVEQVVAEGVSEDALARADMTERAAVADAVGLRWRTWPAVAAAAAVLLVVGVMLTPVREAVAGWLGIGSTRIEHVPPDDADPSGLSPLYTDLVPVSPREAARQLGGPLPAVTDTRLGEPDLLAVPPEGGAILAWDRGSTTLWVRPIDGRTDRVKQVPLDDPSATETVEDLGEMAMLIEGDHILLTPSRRAAAARVLLWVDEGVEYRLESNLDTKAMRSIARSVQIQT